ncbi:drs2 neo1 protein [Neophaeococcomyces mojaviensis]|uniref:Drs2 neo1 protein n=1 Tax=Neophaeococcomyces mojaviensis TaxID=3383035 RepID=A0ACC3A1G2_9EURO|nr:drs2 neo1 protein [Knufia sp. JES_112]
MSGIHDHSPDNHSTSGYDSPTKGAQRHPAAITNLNDEDGGASTQRPLPHSAIGSSKDFNKLIDKPGRQFEGSQHRTVPTSSSAKQDGQPAVASSQPARIVSQGRNRGYSLRRSLFAQNLQKQGEQYGSIMELEPSSSSQHTPPSASNAEKGPAVITIEESPKDEYPPTMINSRHTASSHLNMPTYPSRLRKQRQRATLIKQAAAAIKSIRDRISRATVLPSTVDGRHVQINTNHDYSPIDERNGKSYISNKIRSCKYTIWNFAPKQLYAQFGKLANFYFLIVSILQMIPGLSTTGTYTTIIPLLIFVSISMAKEGYEDIRRNRLDKEENERSTFVLNNTGAQQPSKDSGCEGRMLSNSQAWTKTRWQDVKVGDVVLLERDAAVPADIVLLHSSGADGIAHIETKSLDGETNLKSKKPLDLVLQHSRSEASIARLEADFVVEDPNLDLYKFDGRVSIAGQTLPLTSNEVMYRGSILRNTQSAAGIVVYSGEECKIRMNANKNPRIKAPTLQAKVNKVVIIVACLVFFVAVVESIGYLIWKRTTENSAWYLRAANVPFGHILTSFIIMFNTMLPLSLYVSLEIVKVAQMFMMNDIDMYDAELDIPIEPRTSTLNEELGQVSYIFSDKTGTLTNNSMKFRKMSIAGTAWLHDHDLQEDAALGSSQKLWHKKRDGKGKQNRKQRKDKKSASQVPLFQGEDQDQKPMRPATRSVNTTEFSHTGKTDELLDYIYRRPQSLFARKVRFFILALALCHTCIPEKDDEGEVNYQATSPDELALVSAAQDLGFIVTDRQAQTITVKTYPQGDDDNPVFEIYHILDIIEFSSARKRMSILIRLPDGRICLFCKGADTTIQKLLRQADLVATSVEDIRKRSEIRKSMEAQAVVQRRSAQLSRKSHTLPRRSFNIGRQSSVSGARRESIRESVELWLAQREAGSSMPRRSGIHYTPRPSEHVEPHTRTSCLSGDSPRTSFQTDDLESLVDESIIINDAVVFQRCFSHIDDFATEGLRTLVYGHRFITDEDYQKWKQLYHEAATSLTDRQDKIEKVAESIEQQLELTGATAIEDKLQTGVPDAIERFARAGIRTWMLTGDKRETAINIGHSCRLIKDYSATIILDHQQGDLPTQIAAAVSMVESRNQLHTVLIVDGQTLTFIDADPALQALFTDLATTTNSVICCRASPSQKAGLVKAIRTKVKGSVTLAIGDGANDIAMIQEAHLGIGIAGKEGLQAARTADYSIAQFRFLVKLLLVHGRWNYVRVCKYTLGTFWKEMLFYLVQATYQRWTGYTGTSLYEPWSLSMFNTLFTSLPVIFMGVFEKDLTPSTLIAVPELYNFGQQNRGFNIPTYAWWAFLGACESQIVYFTMYSIYGEALFTRDNQLFAMGALAFTACVTLISLKLQFFELHNKSMMAALAIFLSVGGWWLWNLILSSIYDPSNEIYNVNGGLVHRFGKNTLWWLTLILIVLSVSILEILIKAIKTIYFPNDVETFQVYERDLEIKKRFEESAADLLQAGWNRGTKKSSLEIAREEEELARREAEIQDILDRPRTMSPAVEGPLVGIRKRRSWQPVDFEIETSNSQSEPPMRRSLDVGELFHKGFGMVRKESMK